jgi:hypothetical protein
MMRRKGRIEVRPDGCYNHAATLPREAARQRQAPMDENDIRKLLGREPLTGQ